MIVLSSKAKVFIAAGILALVSAVFVLGKSTYAFTSPTSYKVGSVTICDMISVCCPFSDFDPYDSKYGEDYASKDSLSSMSYSIIDLDEDSYHALVQFFRANSFNSVTTNKSTGTSMTFIARSAERKETVEIFFDDVHTDYPYAIIWITKA